MEARCFNGHDLRGRSGIRSENTGELFWENRLQLLHSKTQFS